MHIYSWYKRWFLNRSPRLFGESFFFFWIYKLSSFLSDDYITLFYDWPCCVPVQVYPCLCILGKSSGHHINTCHTMSSMNSSNLASEHDTALRLFLSSSSWTSLQPSHHPSFLRNQSSSSHWYRALLLSVKPLQQSTVCLCHHGRLQLHLCSS